MTSTPPQPEPWLRGTHAELPAVLRAIIHAFELANEDVHCWTADLSASELHASPSSLTSVAFHLRHIPRSLDRLLTYAEGNQLSGEQILALKTESDPGVSRDELFSEFNAGLASATERVRAFASADLNEPRGVGKKQLPTSVGGLLVHLADHTQRHTGQIVTTAKLLKASRLEESTAVHGLT
ncbi:MAG TPA: DinB family protein [Acidobacteriaceae bacterium]|nr:DinB family protein [Acidobacteriaceae bacterium]